MRGLLLKDFYTLSKSIKIMALVAVFYLIISLVTYESANLVGMIGILMGYLGISSFYYDDMVNWNHYCVSLPVKRRQIVFSKYLFTIILYLIGSVISVGLFFVVKLLGAEGSLLGSISFIIGGGVAICIVYALLMPMMYRFGSEKARFMLIVIFCVLGAVFGGGYLLLKDIPVSLELLGIVFTAFGVLAYILSYFISVKIFEAKEL